jgi:hypothetical protein
LVNEVLPALIDLGGSFQVNLFPLTLDDALANLGRSFAFLALGV